MACPNHWAVGFFTVALALIFTISFATTTWAASKTTSTKKIHKTSAAAVVHMTNALRFSPAKVTIHVGQTVQWVNSAFATHTVTAIASKAKNKKDVLLPKGAKPFGSGAIKPGATFTHTFTVPGRYTYFCIPHEFAGMTGKVIVKPASAQTASAPPSPRAMTMPASSPASDHATHDTVSKISKGPPFVLGAHLPPRPPHYRQATGIEKFLYWLGNFHPPSTDLPIGLTLGAFLSEILLIVTRKQAFVPITRYCVWIGGLAAIGVAALGWCLAGVTFYDGAWLLFTHRILGSVTGLWGLVMIAVMEKSLAKQCNQCRWGFRAVLLIMVLLITATGFFGGAMIYGTDHYAWISTATGN